MALADSGRAIGAVTRLLQDHLIRRGFEVSVGKPEAAATSNTNAKLNLFLYETGFDPGLKNVRLHPSEPEPLWLVLKYLLTAFDGDASASPTSVRRQTFVHGRRPNPSSASKDSVNFVSPGSALRFADVRALRD